MPYHEALDGMSNRQQEPRPSQPPSHSLCHWLDWILPPLQAQGVFALASFSASYFQVILYPDLLAIILSNVTSTSVCSPRTVKLKPIHHFQCMSRLYVKAVDAEEV